MVKNRQIFLKGYCIRIFPVPYNRQMYKLYIFDIFQNENINLKMEELENGTEHRVTEAQIRKRIDLKPTDHPETIRSLKLPGKTVYRGTNPIIPPAISSARYH